MSSHKQKINPGRAGLIFVVVLFLVYYVLFLKKPPAEQTEYTGIEHPGVILHHSASPVELKGELVGVETIDRWHSRRGLRIDFKGRTYSVAYHYVIRSDGQVEEGRPLGALGGHTKLERHNRYIGICLVGDFTVSEKNLIAQKPTPRQIKSLTALLAELSMRYGFSADRVLRHQDVSQTSCPGEGLDISSIRARLRARQR